MIRLVAFAGRFLTLLIITAYLEGMNAAER